MSTDEEIREARVGLRAAFKRMLDLREDEIKPDWTAEKTPPEYRFTSSYRVDSHELARTKGIFDYILAVFFGFDQDGGRNVELSLTDRQRYLSSNYAKIKYPHKHEGDIQEAAQRLRSIRINLQIATNELTRELDWMEQDMRDEIDALKKKKKSTA